MEININSPIYYKDIYGIDNEIAQLCQKIHIFFKEKKYSELINIVGIVPIIVPSEFINQRKYKEKKFCSTTYGFADVQLFTDYNLYVNGSIEQKKIYIVTNVLRSINAIKGKGKIDYKRFESDMMEFCNINNIDI